MNKIDRKSLDKLAEASSEITQIFEEMEVEREIFEGKMHRLVEAMAEAKETAREIMDDAASVAEEYHDEKSEKWQEGDRGQAYAEWRDRLREVADAIAEDIEVPELEAIEQPGWVASIGDPDFAEFEF